MRKFSGEEFSGRLCRTWAPLTDNRMVWFSLDGVLVQSVWGQRGKATPTLSEVTTTASISGPIVRDPVPEGKATGPFAPIPHRPNRQTLPRWLSRGVKRSMTPIARAAGRLQPSYASPRIAISRRFPGSSGRKREKLSYAYLRKLFLHTGRSACSVVGGGVVWLVPVLLAVARHNFLTAPQTWFIFNIINAVLLF